MNLVAQHLWEIKNIPITTEEEKHITLKKVKFKNGTTQILPTETAMKLTNLTTSISTKKVPKKLTRRYLLQQEDWPDWKNSEYKQLKQYEDQQTFGKPIPYPKGANLLNLIWAYIKKDDGTKKARCVCNGSPNRKGTVTIGEHMQLALTKQGQEYFGL